jgi:hypothetical protein
LKEADKDSINKKELQNLKEVCQKYDKMFALGQFRTVVDINLVTKRDLILDKYSVKVGDTIQDIEIKLKKL